MLEKVLTHYERKDGLKPDRNEKIGNASLGALRLAFGKTVIVKHSGVTDEFRSTATEKVRAIALLILLSPLFLFAIPVGLPL